MYSKTVLVGRLGKDPEQMYTKSGKGVTTFSIATTEKYNGEEKTTWHNIVTWGKLSDICAQYLHKGSLVMIEGRIENRSYEANDGATKYVSEIIAREMKMLDSKGGNSDNREQQPVPEEQHGDTGEDVPF